jgi:hypothetical protein
MARSRIEIPGHSDSHMRTVVSKHAGVEMRHRTMMLLLLGCT